MCAGCGPPTASVSDPIGGYLARIEAHGHVCLGLRPIHSKRATPTEWPTGHKPDVDRNVLLGPGGHAVARVGQFVVSLAVLHHELGGLHWPRIKERIWLNLPRDPRTGKARKVVFLWAVPAIAANVLGGFLATRLDAAWTDWLPGLDEPSYANLQVLADPHFQGQWWILGLTMTSLLFNYLLGEELLFHGVLLPRMAGVFGRWDWVANTVLFGLYHVHKIWAWPSMITSSFGYAWAAKRFRSLWMSVIVHGIEGYFIVLVVAVLAGWYA